MIRPGRTTPAAIVSVDAATTARAVERRRTAFAGVVALGGLSLFAVSWRLWLPQTLYPRVPLIAPRLLGPSPGPLASGIDVFALGLIVLGLGAFGIHAWRGISTPDSEQLAWHRWTRRAAWLAPLGIVLAVLADQHRLQPWAYQLFAFLVLCLGCRAPLTLHLGRLLIVGIYFWSALSKLDYQFAHTVGSQMVTQGFELLGGNAARLTHQGTASAAMWLPAGELIVAMALGVPRTRKAGVIAALLMHLSLILILGPLGMDHRPSVLLWNLCFLFQVPLLFWPMTRKRGQASLFQPTGTATPLRTPRSSQAAGLLVGLMIGLPIIERDGWLDHWPAWALYAPHSSRVRMRVPAHRLDDLPNDLTALLPASSRVPWQWVEVPLSEWSLEILSVPIYPQDRFQLGVAIAVAEAADLGRDVRIDLRSVSDRKTGEREEIELNGLEQMLGATERFWFNARPLPWTTAQ